MSRIALEYVPTSNKAPARYKPAFIKRDNDIIMITGGRNVPSNQSIHILSQPPPRSPSPSWTWTRVDGLDGEHPTVRWGCSATFLKEIGAGAGGDGKIYLFGGWDSKYQYKDLYALDIERRIWSKPRCNDHEDIMPIASMHSALQYQDKIWYFGGAMCVGGPYIYHDDLATMSLVNGSPFFQAVNSSGDIPCGRAQHTAVVFEKKMYILCGVKEDTVLNDVFVFDFATSVWSQVQTKGDAPPTYKYNPANFRVHPGHGVGRVYGHYVVLIGNDRRLYAFDLLKSSWHSFTLEFQNDYDDTEITLDATCVAPCIMDHRLIILNANNGGGGGSTTRIDEILDPTVFHTLAIDLDTMCEVIIQKEQDDALSQAFLARWAGRTADKKTPEQFEFKFEEGDDAGSIVVARSRLVSHFSYFQKMLDSNMTESREGHVTIRDVSRHDFQEILNFLFDGKLPPFVSKAPSSSSSSSSSSTDATIPPTAAAAAAAPDMMMGQRMWRLFVACARYDVQSLEKIIGCEIVKGLDENNACFVSFFVILCVYGFFLLFVIYYLLLFH
eukprot:TRINITY_DN2375_c0_g1_i3.p1 TRINITY_DN2375_c0_g1~~TRINITY_DN2375_c0_g1_i3.p1  ORF type:complete len:568 (-),score=108.88 TRINITY_DN2375_c0_g1_i3:274-1935(-)